MPGRQEFEAVVAQAPKKKLKGINLTQTFNVAVNARTDYDLYSATGTISNVKNFDCYATAPPGATTGSHQFILSGVYGGYAKINAPYNVINYWDSGSPVNPGMIYVPNDLAGINDNVKAIHFDDTFSLVLTYENLTNAIQTQLREFKLIVVEEQVKG